MRSFWNDRVYRDANTGGAGGGGAGGVGDAGTAAPTATAGAPAAVAAPAAQIWTDGIEDASLREFAVNKGYHKEPLDKAAPSIIRQYQNLEKLFGAEKAGRTVEIPNFDDPTAGDAVNSFYDRMGRPKEAKDYDMAAPKEGQVNTEFLDSMRGVLHKAGVTGRAATQISKGYQEYAAAQTAAEAAGEQQRFALEDASLKREWGAAYGDKMSKASAVARSLGVPGEVIDTIQKHAGYSAAMKTFANLADKLGEASYVDGDRTNPGGVMTPAEADGALKALAADKEWMAAWLDKQHPKHKEAVERKQFLTGMLKPVAA